MFLTMKEGLGNQLHDRCWQYLPPASDSDGAQVVRCQLEAADSAPIHLLAILCKYDMHFLLMILKLI